MRLSLLGSRVTHLEAPVHTHSRWPLDLGRAWIVARRIVGEEQNPPEHRLGLTNWVTASAEWPLVYTTWAATPAGVCWLRYASVDCSRQMQLLELNASLLQLAVVNFLTNWAKLSSTTTARYPKAEARCSESQNSRERPSGLTVGLSICSVAISLTFVKSEKRRMSLQTLPCL